MANKSKAPTSKEKKAISTAVRQYRNVGNFPDLMDAGYFLSRVTADIDLARLRYLCKHFSYEVAQTFGAKSIEYIPGYYKPSGRGKFGRLKGGDSATTVKPSVLITY